VAPECRCRLRDALGAARPRSRSIPGLPSPGVPGFGGCSSGFCGPVPFATPAGCAHPAAVAGSVGVGPALDLGRRNPGPAIFDGPLRPGPVVGVVPVLILGLPRWAAMIAALVRRGVPRPSRLGRAGPSRRRCSFCGAGQAHPDQFRWAVVPAGCVLASTGCDCWAGWWRVALVGTRSTRVHATGRMCASFPPAPRLFRLACSGGPDADRYPLTSPAKAPPRPR